MKTRRNIRYLWFVILITFSGIFLLVSCEHSYYTFLSGGGPAVAKFGDTTINFRDTISSNGYSIKGENLLFFTNEGTPKSHLGLKIAMYTNPGFVGTYNLNNYFYNYASITGILAATSDYNNYYTDSTHTGVLTINSYNPQFGNYYLCGRR